MHDILIHSDNSILLWENSNITAIPKNVSLIAWELWQKMIGEPEKDNDGNSIKTFEQMEKEFIISNGWTCEELGII